ncbi:MAG TPA: hypothetical protein VLQ76_05200, partial [Bacteroidales bacterium]|nr:hypothetical protein [Bacteroidales bacterium]
MKRMVKFITLALAVVILSSEFAAGQQATTGEKSKSEAQKEAEIIQKKADEIRKKAEITNKTQMELELKRAEAALEGHAEALKDYEMIRKKAEGMSDHRIIIMPGEEMWNMKVPYMDNNYFFGEYGIGDKPGSSWNYSRQVMESTFTNEFIMDSGGDNGNATLSLSGTCAEGVITVAIIMPDGKQLSEVIIDANGSLNWRK